MLRIRRTDFAWSYCCGDRPAILLEDAAQYLAVWHPCGEWVQNPDPPSGSGPAALENFWGCNLANDFHKRLRKEPS